MIKPIVRSEIVLRRPAREATADDLQVAQDLLDTLLAHRQNCAGMAANMIGQPVAIIAFFEGEDGQPNREPIVMLNPRITEKRGPYQTEEGCLSLDGLRAATRYRRIKVSWQDATPELAPRTRQFTGFTAEVIQHEVDHLAGVII